MIAGGLVGAGWGMGAAPGYTIALTNSTLDIRLGANLAGGGLSLDFIDLNFVIPEPPSSAWSLITDSFPAVTFPAGLDEPISYTNDFVSNGTFTLNFGSDTSKLASVGTALNESGFWTPVTPPPSPSYSTFNDVTGNLSCSFFYSDSTLTLVFTNLNY